MSHAADGQRQPHAVLDMPSRQRKAEKIECLLGLEPRDEPYRLLEVGCGSGGISHYFATRSRLRCEVHAIDVHDNRQVTAGYAFRLVDGVDIPFPDGHFDIVLSNHVIEHVGPAEAQAAHLRELLRVCAPGGTGYLAVPNRWMLVEPHYRLPFLSWWPRRWRSRWLRLFRDASHYDCEPLSMAALEGMLHASGWRFANAGDDAVAAMARIEPGAGLLMYDRLPAWLKRRLRPAMPTLIYRLSSPGR